MPLFGRLRTQLILSHLAAIAFTLVAMVAAVVLIAGSWIAAQQGSFGEPTQQARLVASAIGGLVSRGSSSTDLNSVLRLLASGELGLPVGLSPWTPQSTPQWAPQSAQGVRSGAALHDVSYVAVVGPDGRVLASSDPAGAGFAPPERA